MDETSVTTDVPRFPDEYIEIVIPKNCALKVQVQGYKDFTVLSPQGLLEKITRDPGELTPEEIDMIVKDRRPINAIKSVRYRLGISLKMAKDIVDKWRADNGHSLL